MVTVAPKPKLLNKKTIKITPANYKLEHFYTMVYSI